MKAVTPFATSVDEQSVRSIDDELELAHSRLIQACAEAERFCAALILDREDKLSASSGLGGRCDQLLGLLTAKPAIFSNATSAGKWLKDLKKINELRALLAHSVIERIDYGTVTQLGMRAANQHHELYDTVHIISLTALIDCTRRVHQRVNSLRQLAANAATPPSQPQPAPAAATAP